MKIKSMIAGLLGAMVLSAFSTVTFTAEAANVVPVHLKVGKYSILYTQPAPPFADQAHRVQVPLRSIEDLLGGKVKYNPSFKTADVEWMGHTFQFMVNSKIVQIDGKTVQMDTTPVLKNQAMFLPIRFFLDATDVKWRWDQASQQIILSDDRVVKGEPFEDFIGMDATSVKNENAMVIQSYSIKGKYMTITALNVSGHTIPAGKADINPLFHYSNGQFGMDPYSRSSEPPLKAVRKGDTVSKKIRGNITGDVDYVITVGRELN
ncbi:copper amine oxidase N-terminal domain-containing protein [Paenibacillus bovis]|nr:copper amine oxidase N-terminal domain-containing protein [Paenibacillus bovis]